MAPVILLIPWISLAAASALAIVAVVISGVLVSAYFLAKIFSQLLSEERPRTMNDGAAPTQPRMEQHRPR